MSAEHRHESRSAPGVYHHKHPETGAHGHCFEHLHAPCPNGNPGDLARCSSNPNPDAPEGTRAEVRNNLPSIEADHADVDLIASGYEATCPGCEELCLLIEVPRFNQHVTCPACGATFTTGLPEHAIG